MIEPIRPRVGRPSLMVERRRQIIDAFIQLVAERGLENVTLDDVAAAAEIQRAALHHFAGNRDQLIEAAITELCRRYECTIRDVGGQSPTITALVATLFSADWTRGNGSEDAAFDMLAAEGIRRPHTRGAIKAAYDLLPAETAAVIARGHSNAPTARIRDTAYVDRLPRRAEHQLPTDGLSPRAGRRGPQCRSAPRR